MFNSSGQNNHKQQLYLPVQNNSALIYYKRETNLRKEDIENRKITNSYGVYIKIF